MAAVISTSTLLAVQKVCAITICQACKVGLPSERSARKHLADKHSISIAEARSQATRAFDAAKSTLSDPHPLRNAYLCAPEKEASPPSNIILPAPPILSPLAGIEQVLGYQCVICPCCYSSERRIRDHFSEKHSDYSDGIEALYRLCSQNGQISMQSLFGGNKTSYFPVSSAAPIGELFIPPSSYAEGLCSPDTHLCPPSSEQTELHPNLVVPEQDKQDSNELIFSDLNRVLNAPTDRHQNLALAPTNPFLARTLFDKHLKEFGLSMGQAAEYSALLADRSSSENLIVKDVTAYLLRVPTLIMNVSQSILKDVNLRGYKEFTSVSTRSAERYARSFARLVISAIRSQNCGFFPAHIRPKIAQYISSINSSCSTETDRLELLYKLLASISFQELDNINSPRRLFVFQFITFASVLSTFRTPNNSFRFADASDISRLLSSLLYGTTSCALTEIHELGLQAKAVPQSLGCPLPTSAFVRRPPDTKTLPVSPKISSPTKDGIAFSEKPCSSKTQCLNPDSSLNLESTRKHLIDRSKEVLACFDETKNTAPSTVRRLLTMALDICKADDVKFNFDTCQDHQLCGIVKNVHIGMKHLGNITRSLHHDIRQLIDELAYGAPLPDNFFSDIANLTDVIQDKSPGFSFLVHSANIPKVRQYSSWLFHQITSDRPRGKAFFSPSSETPSSKVITVLGAKIKRHAVQDWLAKAKSLQDKLLSCVHITSGSPGRSTELETLCLYNTHCHPRNVYISQGRLVIVTRYIKQRWLIGADKVIPRFPDQETGKLFLTYLVLFRTIEGCFIEKLFDTELSTTHMTSLFTERGIPFSAAKIRDVITSTFHANSLPILFNHFRHFSAGIIDEITQNSSALIRQQLVSDARTIAHLQAGHSPETAETNYARRSDDIPSVTISALNNYRAFSYAWHKHLGLLNEPEVLPDHQQPRQASTPSTHSLPSSLSQSISASVASTVKNEFQKFSRVLSVSKRQFKDSVSSLSPPAKKFFAPRIRCAPLRDSLKDLNRFLPILRVIFENDNASFTSELQLHVTAAVKEKNHNLLVLMPTGAGKSLTFQIPAFMEKTSSTVVFVPLAALVHEHVSSCTKLGVLVATWENRHLQAQVYIISMDHSVQELRSFLLNLQEHGRLARIIIDEAHLLLLWFAFRESMQRLSFGLQACDRSVQIVLLTATLPPSYRERLLSLLSIPSIVLHAAPTIRENLRFTVIQCSNSIEKNLFKAHRTLMMNALWGLVKEQLELLQENGGDGKILIFTLYRLETEALHKELVSLLEQNGLHHVVSTRAYHAAMPSADLKSTYDFWKSQDTQIKLIVATSAFGTGLDVPDVRLVVHFGGSAGLLQYAQEAGRAGRDGKHAQCTVIYNKIYADAHTGKVQSDKSSSTFSIQEYVEDQALDWELMRHYMSQTNKCRKNYIYSFIDGEGPGMCLFDNNSENCDVCDALLDHSAQPTGSSSNVPQTSYVMNPSLSTAAPQSSSDRDNPISQAFSALPTFMSPEANSNKILSTPLSSQLDLDLPFISSPPQCLDPKPLERRLSFSESPTNNHPLPITVQNTTNLLQEFRTICRSLQNLCVACIVFENRQELSQHRCKHMRNRCRRCFKLGHQVTSCETFDPKRKNHCYSCSLNQLRGENVHQPGEFGRRCFMSVARNIAWAFWSKGPASREQMATCLFHDIELRHLEQSHSPEDVESINFYNTWLRTSWDGVSNLVRFFLWWHNLARSL